MIDLSGIARHLRLPVEQIRIAGDLLQQGYQPAFIARYRADETGCLPRSILWSLKLEIDRQIRLQATQERLVSQLPKDAELDEEARRYLEQATTEVEMEAVLKALRARRALALSQGRDTQAGQLLERLIAYNGAPIADIKQWAAEQFSLDAEAVENLHEQTLRLVGSLLHCDTALQEKLRRLIQKKASIRVEPCEPTDGGGSNAGSEKDKPVEKQDVGSSKHDTGTAEAPPSSQPAAEQPAAEQPAAEQPAAEQLADTKSVADQPAETQPTNSASAESHAPQTASNGTTAVEGAESTSARPQAVLSSDDAASTAAADVVEGSEQVASAEAASAEAASPEAANTDEPQTETTEVTIGFGGEGKKKSAGKKKKKEKPAAKKPVAKMTPRQRRRRWLISMLTPMRNMKRPLLKLTAYQRLMLGRGRRSQLVKTDLLYETRSLVPISRDTFVSNDHPLSPWFDSAVATALDQGLRERMEQDAVADLEEIASEKLLLTAAEQLRQTLMRRPVRGHRILVVDTVGPKAAAVAIVDAAGKVLETCEIPCSVQPQVVSQNVVRLGELVHKHRVTLVALTNGPARRFLVQTIRELMKQSADSGLRWTMADRSGADAYAAGRIALRELSLHNRRDRAAIWVARSLQDPLAENLKIDISRLRLGSYQRELPQDSLKQLIRETLADCVCSRGIDTHHASVAELSYVPGIAEAQAKQIAALAGNGGLQSRAQLLSDIADWPESESRQAIGMLRVYDSPQPLDATTIHPDDYRLAERLVNNTELEMPPARPEGWEPPGPSENEEATAAAEPAASTTASDETNTAESASTDSAPSEVAEAEAVVGDTSTPPAEATVDSGADVSSTSAEISTESPAVGSKESADAAAAEATGEASDEATADAAEPPPSTSDVESSEPAADSTESTTAESTPAEAATDGEATDGEAAGNDAPAPAAAEAAPPPSGVKPEYSEDVAAQVPTPPPVDVEKLARGWQVGREKLRSLVHNLHTPFADPRLLEPPVPMLSDMPTLSTLQPGTCLWAVVAGVAEFGAFVELGPDCSGLIHISRLSAEYVEDPHQCVQVGDLLMTWVVSVDEKNNRVALTTLSPSERAAAEAAASERRQTQQAERRGGANRRGGDRSGGHGAAAGGQRSVAGQGGGPRGGGGGGRSGGGRDGGGGRGGARGRGGPPRGRGQGRSSQPSGPVVVTSKKPKAKITEAMKDGAEPLRSFSDLMQFYEEKRTDDAPTVTSADAPTPAKPEPSESESAPSETPNTHSDS